MGFKRKSFCALSLFLFSSIFFLPSLNILALSVSLTHHLILLPLCLSYFCLASLLFLLSFSLPLLLGLTNGPIFWCSCIFPSELLSSLPHPHLLLRVAYQRPQCHDYKGSERSACPCCSASHWDQVTTRGYEPVLLVWL